MEKKAALVQFGRAVREFRKATGLSQEDLADKTEIHRTYIGGIERGERNPTYLMIVRIARALQVSAAQLLQLTEEIADESGQKVE